MAATVKIDFAIGGSDLGAKMTRTIVQATQAATREQLRISDRAAAAEVRARAQAERDKARATERAAKEAARAEVQAQNSAIREVLAMRKAQAKQEAALAKEAASARKAEAREAAAFQRELDRAGARAFRERVRDQDRSARQQEREAKAREKTLNGYIGSAGRGAMAGVGALASGASRLAGAGMGLAGSLMGGMGLEASIGHALKTRTERESLSVDIANSALGKDADLATRRSTAADLRKTAADVGQETAMDPTKVLEGIQKFVSKTGDLKTANATIRELAVLSRATGTSMEDMVDAAGDASANLPDTADKAQQVVSVMRAMAGQGKLGAVEIRDLATQMAKLASSAGQFTGNASENMAILGALAQEARQKGGASSATMAATSVQGFVNILKTPSRAKEFHAAGINLIDEKTKLLRNPQEIIEEAIQKRGMDPIGFKKLFANTAGARAVEGFANIYRAEGGGAKGMAAVRAEFSKLKSASMGEGETKASFDASMETAAAKAERFQQQIDKVVGDLADKLIPSFLKMTPVAEKGAEVLGKFIDQVEPVAGKLSKALLDLAPVAEKTASGLAKVVNFASEYPKLFAGGVIAGYIAKEMASHAISNMNIAAAVVNLTGGTPGGVVGGAGGLRALATTPVGAATAGQKAGAAGMGAVIGVGMGVATGEAITTDLGKRETRALTAQNLASKIRMGNATPEEIAQAKALTGQLEQDKGQGAFGRFITNATAGYRGVANGDLSAGNVASLFPGVAVARGVVGGALEGQQQEVDKNTGVALDELKAALQNPKPMQLAPGAGVTITNVGEIAAAVGKGGGRDPASQPITGK